MTALLTRELTGLGRRRSLWAVPVAQATLLSGFILAWGGAGVVPFLEGANLYEQQRTVLWMFQSVALPWAVCRAASGEHRDAWAHLSLLTATDPGRLLLARLAACATYIACLLAACAPVMVLAQQMSAVPASRLMLDAVILWLFGVGTAAVTLHFTAWTRGPLAAWIGATAAALLLRSAVARVPPQVSLPAVAIVALAAATVLMARANRTLACVAERAR